MLPTSTEEPAGVNANDIVQKIWTLCNVLRDDGITYHQYVSELTYLLFLKMAQAHGGEIERQIPAGYRWEELQARSGHEQLEFYTNQLRHLGRRGPTRVSEIFADARTSIRTSRNLRTLVEAIDQIDWLNADREQFGHLYDGLLEKNAGEKMSGAGQYFTPRPLISSMVSVIQPRPGEVVQDPAAG
ncbi:MAG: SAM-dependent DNA methyltransferase, partial [Myxococcaceae bacterium]